MPEDKKSTPRLKAVPMASDPDISIGIGEKGGISVYLGARWPVTLYFDQWKRLLRDEIITEIILFGEQHAELLSEKAPIPGKAEPTRMVTLSSVETAILDKEIAFQTEQADVPKAVHYATLKSLADQNGGKLPVDKMVEIFTLKATQASRK